MFYIGEDFVEDYCNHIDRILVLLGYLFLVLTIGHPIPVFGRVWEEEILILFLMFGKGTPFELMTVTFLPAPPPTVKNVKTNNSFASFCFF